MTINRIPGRDDCAAMDAADTIGPLRAQFALPDGVIYLDGNSLGARPKIALQRATQVVADEWGRDLIKSWNTAGWFDLPRRLGDKLAPLIGAQADEVVVTDTTSTNLFKSLAAALRIQDRSRTVIVSERSNFPTDLYMAQGLIDMLASRGGSPLTLRLIDDPQELPSAVGADTAVVMLTHVNYRTGAMHDMAGVTALAHQHGALMLWDLAHSAGAVPVDLHDAQADFAIGCTYKYLNGGPGSPAFIWVPKRHQPSFRQPLSGWWGHARPFSMAPGYEPANGIAQALCGTQPITSLAMVECGLDIFVQTDIQALRCKSLALTDLFIALVESRCAGFGLELVTPRAHERRGSQVGFMHEHGFAMMQALIASGVIGDYREPGIMRFGFAPLYVRYVDVWDAVEALRLVITEERWRAPQFMQRGEVT